MRLTFLGTGTAWSKPPENFNNNAIVDCGEGKQRWLIDCGTTAPVALHQLGLSVADFTGVLVTHMHGDHVFGLEETGFFNYFVLKRRVKLWLPGQLMSSRSGIPGEDLWENCLRGPMGTVQLLDGSPYEVGLDDYFDVQFLEEHTPYDLEGVKVELFEVDHVPHKPCYGLILNDQVAYTSDCKYSRDRIDTLLDRGCHTIFHDCYFGPAFRGRVHSAFVEIAELPPSIASHIVLMHYNDNVPEEELQRARDAGFRLARKAQTFDFG